MGHSLPGFSVHGILQAGILEWVSTPSSRYSSTTHPQFEENETVFEWLSGTPKVKKQLLDSALTCKVGNTVRHSFTEIFYVLGAMLSSLLSTFCFPGGSDGNKSACHEGHLGSVPGWGGSSGERKGNPFQYSRPENPHGQRSLAGYSPWGHKDLGMA